MILLNFSKKHMSKKHILLADDSEAIAESLIAYLNKEGFEVSYVKNGLDAVHDFKSKKFDLVILDWMMPGMSGPEIIKEIRKSSEVPILMISARSDESDVVIGLDFGADEYITKPFGPRELIARVKAMFRRIDNLNNKNSYVVIRNLKISFTQREIIKNNQEVSLTPIEFNILECLVEQEGKVISRDYLMEHALDYTNAWKDRTLDTHIKNLRKKLEDNHESPQLIKTVRGVGFKFIN